MPRVGSKHSIVAHAAGHPAGDRDLLLVAARQAPDLALRRGCRSAAARSRPVDLGFAPRPRLIEPPASEPGARTAARCSRAPSAASAAPRRGRPGRTRRRHGSRRRGAGTSTGEPSTSELARRSGGRAREDVEQLVLALALERDDAQHLARVELERDVLELACRGSGCGPRSAARVGGDRGGAGRGLASPSVLDRSGRASARRSCSSEPAVTSTTPTVTPSRSTVARSQTAAISIIRCEMKMTRALAAALAADDLEHPLGEVRGQRRGHLVEHEDVRLDGQRAGEVDDPQRGQRHAARHARQVEVARGRARPSSGGTARAASRSGAGWRGCPGPGSAPAPGTPTRGRRGGPRPASGRRAPGRGRRSCRRPGGWRR